MRRLVLVATPPLLVFSALLLPALAAPGPDKKEQQELKEAMGKAASENDWNTVAEKMARLGETGDRATWKFLVKVAEKAPEDSTVPRTLREIAEKQDKLADEAEKTALDCKSAEVRRYLTGWCAERKRWSVLVKAVGDSNEEVASLAAWKLVENRVEEGVEPLIAAMEKLDGKGRTGIWDVLRNGLHRLLGKRLESGAEYRSLWTTVKEAGGLSAVKMEAAPAEGGGGTMVRLFGREIECPRVVFILDCSGSMTAIDPTQEDPLAGANSRVRAPPPGPSGAPQPKPQGKTRMERAKIALTEMLKRLPPQMKINLICYDSNVNTWRGSLDGKPPELHDMNEKNRAEAIDWISKQEPRGVTVTDDAIKSAFDIKGARCFYVLSDGFVTHDGQTQIPTDQIIRMIKEQNAERHVVIHTLGFEGADREMMQAVAEATGGKYSDIR